MYRYNVFFRANGSTKITSAVRLIQFRTPVQKGEKILLASHIKKLWDYLPKWALEQGTWLVKEVIHTVEGEQVTEQMEADILIVVPAADPLLTKE
ncbi:MAG: hypothetical protein HYW70_02835 [Candidatus Nealsonbacteria bacterium]|nr:hypothetical protein [Candidatus Nealsonbacteria bacterium]